MIDTGAKLSTFITGLNGGASIDPTLLEALVDTAKTIIEGERPWMVLRKTDSNLSASASGTWQTAIPLSIDDFSRFSGEFPIRLFDGDNRIEYYRQVPLERRLEYKNVSGTFVFDENAGEIYLNGSAPFDGTLYVNYIATTDEIDLESEDMAWSPFPKRFLALLGYYAVGIHKGAVDYDEINQAMLPENRATMLALKDAMEDWDNERQLSSLEGNDPNSLHTLPRGGAIDTNY